MYQHLLVPIDGSRLSNATVEQAVAYAQATRAHLTFLYAQPDYVATDEGAIMHASAPTVFAEAATGNARVLLAKAEAAARGAGVTARSVAVVSDRPHEAILEAAGAHGCDLIFMASRGRRGLKGVLLGSVTQRVLQQATLPVLVASVEHNKPPSDEQRAIATIKDEHRSLAAVVQALQRLVSDDSPSADPTLLRAMIFYIETFSERLHHPKEESQLFARLRERTSECDAVIDALTLEHRAGTALFERLRAAVAAHSSTDAGTRGALLVAVTEYTEAQWRHMAAEEQLILPAASRHLLSSDWTAIAAAFDDNADPRFGMYANEPFEHLATKLLNLAASHPSSTQGH